MKLTQEERRRMFVAQQAARQAMLDRLQRPASIESSGSTPSVRRRWLKTLAIAMLIGGGLLAYSVVQFHPPTSIEALLPRL